MNPVDSTRTRKTILQAANRVVLRDGSNSLTLDAVAKEAGVSKGGLLYHFPSKDALISAMVDDLIQTADESMRVLQAGNPNPRGSWTRAYINVCRESDETDSISAAMIPAAASNPELLEPMRKMYEIWQRKLDEDLGDRSTSTLIRLALDGLWLVELFNLNPPRGARRDEFFNMVIKMTEHE
ncbi:MAG: TetR/AcrR family transcriptional regulator [Chloroflexi bacterium]|nr:TetR/AcrR family transcriptional regulator [Chloroflexota bacterium]